MWLRRRRPARATLTAGSASDPGRLSPVSPAARPPVTKSQKTAAGAGRFLTPATERKIRNRNRTFRILSSSAMTGLFGWLAKRTANTGSLRDYPLDGLPGPVPAGRPSPR